jgi:hypothetical protein
MNFETTSSLLSVWDQAPGEKPGRQALLLLAHLANHTLETAGFLRIGERDALLLKIRERLFGPEAEATAVCPACQDVAEFSFRPGALIVASPEIDNGERDFGEYRVAFRSPTAADAATVCSEKAIGAAKAKLLQRCLLYARYRGELIAPSMYRRLPVDLLEFLAAEMEAADPQAVTQFALVCPSCNHAWTETFDVVSFLWQEIAAAATRILREVHDLAVHYGWSQADILTMHPARRRMYLRLAEA